MGKGSWGGEVVRAEERNPNPRPASPDGARPLNENVHVGSSVAGAQVSLTPGPRRGCRGRAQGDREGPAASPAAEP